MFVRSDIEWGDSLIFFFVVVNVICLKLEKLLAYKMICRTSYEIRFILMRSRSQYSCTEWYLSTTIGWGLLFGFLFSFWGRLVLNWRCDWQWFGCIYFLLYHMRCCWLWDGTGGDDCGTGTLWYCTGMEICDRVGVLVVTGITIVRFLLARPKKFWYFDKFVFGFVTIL